MTNARAGKAFLLLLLVCITAAFLWMLRRFLLTVLLAAIFSALVHPLYERLLRLYRGRKGLASLTTLFLLVVVVVGPLLALAGVLAGEALQISESVQPWIQRQLARPESMEHLMERIPLLSRLEPYRDSIIGRAAEFVGNASTFLIAGLSNAASGTASFFFHLGILLYAMFYFLVDGAAMLRRALGYLPLQDTDAERLLDRFTSVSRATIKGTLLIAMAQGVLGGLAFAVAGIRAPVFWGTLMTALSVLPGIGSAIVWIPAVIFLLLTDHLVRAVVLALYCSLIVGSVDNVLRPRLVGRDTQLHDLLIFFGTIGGIAMFGILGFIFGPLLAALCLTVWDIYGAVFAGWLPPAERRRAP